MQEGAGGLDVVVRVADREEADFKGKLDFAENRIDNASGTMRVRARFPNAGGILQPGMFGRINVPGSLPHPGVLVPDEAIGADQDRRIVFVVDETGMVSAKPVRTGPLHRRLSGDPRGPDRRGDHRRQRAVARQARHQGKGRNGDVAAEGPDRRVAAMRFAHFFVDRPIFASVVSIVLLIIGAIAYTQLPVAQYPEIAPPTIVVRAQYPGADAETVAATVATPIEQEINGVEDMLYMSSYSSGDGSMALTITFKLGTDLDQAQVLVQNRVSVAEPRLPEEVRRLGVTTAKSSPDLMMVVHMLSPDNTYDQLYVSNYARSRVRDILLRLDGVGDLIIFGEREYSLRIWLDPEKLSAYGMTSGDIVQALARPECAGVGRLDRRTAERCRQRVPVHGDDAGPLQRRARLPLRDRQVDRRRAVDLAAGRCAH